MTRGQIEDKIEEWHDMYPSDEDSVVSLCDFLGMTSEEYSIFVEWNVLPNESIEYDKFVEIRNDRLKVCGELARYKEAIEEIASYVSPNRDVVEDVLDRYEITPE